MSTDVARQASRDTCRRRSGRTLLLATLLQVAATGTICAADVSDASKSAADPSQTAVFRGAVTPASPVASASATDVFTYFRREFDAGNFTAAVPYAQRVLEMAEKQAATPTAEEVQVALMNLATTQYLAGDYVAAEASYQRVIGLVESSGRPLNARLARAHAGLASTYHDADRHDLAVASFEQAISFKRRQEGLLTEQQLPLLEKYIDSLTVLGRYETALQAHKYMLRIATRKYGEDSPELAPSLEKLGRWLASVGAYDQARRVLKRAINIVEDAEGNESPRLVSPLMALADCARRQLLDPGAQLAATADAERASMFHDPSTPVMPYSPGALAVEGEKALLRAAQIAEQGENPSQARIADVRTQLGDWYQVRGQPERALRQYEQAWTAAARVAEKVQGKVVTEALFGKPVLLHVVRPESWSKYAQRPRDQVEVRTVAIEMTVSAQGLPENARIVDDSGDGKRAEKTLAAVQSARYRPRFENGRPVATPDVGFAQPWILLLESRDEAPAAPAPAPAEQAPKPPS